MSAVTAPLPAPVRLRAAIQELQALQENANALPAQDALGQKLRATIGPQIAILRHAYNNPVATAEVVGTTTTRWKLYEEAFHAAVDLADSILGPAYFTDQKGTTP